LGHTNFINSSTLASETQAGNGLSMATCFISSKSLQASLYFSSLISVTAMLYKSSMSSNLQNLASS
jgi:hypothetical protein